uniref:Uncharacterized protein n=1 Tax=Rhodopseudomonas palustris (strain BisA53) TaxID=316055 RepID=Q07QU1_RHOP5
MSSILLTHYSGFDQMIRMMGNDMSDLRTQREEHEPFVQRTAASDEGVMVTPPSIEDPELTTAQSPTLRKPNASRTSGGSSERADIARRVSAFRDRQRLIRQQREDYLNAVQAETRAALRGPGGIPRN